MNWNKEQEKKKTAAGCSRRRKERKEKGKTWTWSSDKCGLRRKLGCKQGSCRIYRVSVLLSCPGHTVRYLLPPVRQTRGLVLSTALAYYLGRALTARPLSGVRVAREIELPPWGGTRKTVFQFL